MIVALPPETPLIVAVKLSPSTVATLVSEDDHNTLALVGPEGLNNSCTVPVLPLSIAQRSLWHEDAGQLCGGNVYRPRSGIEELPERKVPGRQCFSILYEWTAISCAP